MWETGNGGEGGIKDSLSKSVESDQRSAPKKKERQQQREEVSVSTPELASIPSDLWSYHSGDMNCSPLCSEEISPPNPCKRVNIFPTTHDFLSKKTSQSHNPSVTLDPQALEVNSPWAS
jgi:hypothetical protein